MITTPSTGFFNLPFAQLSATGSVFGTSVFTPGVGSMTNNMLAGQTLSDTIVDLTGGSIVSYQISSLSVGSTTALSHIYPSPANIVGTLKTSVVYDSTENGANTVYVVYSVTDSIGRSQCSPTGASVSMTVGSASSLCIIFTSPAVPHGTCLLVVNSAIFSFASVNLPVSLTLSVNSIVVQTSSLGSVLLAPVPSQSVPFGLGIYFQLPIYVAVAGDSVSVQMWAQTGGANTMESWGASVVYDTSYLSFTTVVHPLYTTVLTSTSVTHALNMTGSGGSGGISGWFMAAALSFVVMPAASGGTIQVSMPAILTNAMTNGVPITYHNNFVGLFADSRGGWAFTSGQLVVLSPAYAGVYAYSVKSSFVNLFALNGVTLTDAMVVVGTYNTGRTYAAYADTVVQPSSCTSANSAVFNSSVVSSGCSVSLAPLGGASSVAITASFGGFSAVVAYRAYFFLDYYLNSTRVQLRRLGCDFETSYLSAYGVITLDGFSALQIIDISNVVSFTSDTPSVVSVSGRVATGVAVGSATVSYGGGVSSTSLVVSNAAATVVYLVSYAYSGAAVTPSSAAETEFGTTLVQVQPVLSLTAELQTAFVVTYAMDDDGVWSDVSRYNTLSLSSTTSADLIVSKSGSDWLLQVPVGASSVSSSVPVIGGVLSDSCSTVLTSAGYGYVSTNLSEPVAIVVSANSALLARPGTPAASTLALPSSTQLIVTVTFRSSVGVLSYRDFTADTRTMYTATFVQSVGSLSSSALLSLTSSSGLGSGGSVTISVSMPSYAPASGLTGTLVIPVVDVNTTVPLQGSLVHAMTPSVPVSSSSPLKQIACTGVFQSGLLSTVLVTLTDGSTRSGTPLLASSNQVVAVVSGTSVTALAQGTSVITASYATATGLFTAYVSGSTASVTAMSLFYGSSTLSGQTGSSSAGTLSVSFSDGTSFTNAITQFSPLSALVSFNSSDPNFITVSAAGVAALINNSWHWAVLAAFSRCGDGRSSTFSMAGNLAALTYDTKLGSTTGITFPPKSNGQSVDASVKVQVASSPLTTYQVWLFYNSGVLGTPTISKGSGWPTGAFDFTTGNVVTGNIMKAILSFSSGSSATNALVQMATVMFPVISNSSVLELITASVVAMSVASGIIFQSATGTPIVAGTGYVSLNGGTNPSFRRLLLSSDVDEIEVSSRRLLQSGLPLVTGDCNGDGLFNANDATYAQALVTNGVSSWPISSISQMRNCAPTYSYMFNAVRASYAASQIQVTIADVAYLLHASTNRVFFLNISSPFDLVLAVPSANGQLWSSSATYYYYPLSTSVSSYSAAPCASVSGYFEMNVASLPYTVSVGSLYGSTTTGVAFQGMCSSGTFGATIVTNWQNVLNMSVGFINSATGDAYAFFGMDVGAFVNANTNFVNIMSSTIVSGPIYTFSVSYQGTLTPTVAGYTYAPSSTPPASPSGAPVATSPAFSGQTYSPTGLPHSSSSPSFALVTVTPTVSGFTNLPSSAPTVSSSSSPVTQRPTFAGYTYSPTVAPSGSPSSAPATLTPTVSGFTNLPSVAPTVSPSSTPVTQSPTFAGFTYSPTVAPSGSPSSAPVTVTPTVSGVTNLPSAAPTVSPSSSPVTQSPTFAGFLYSPTVTPSSAPVTLTPTVSGFTNLPSAAPTVSPSSSPVIQSPTFAWFTYSPTVVPSGTPSSAPVTLTPTVSGFTNLPSVAPNFAPSSFPVTVIPTVSGFTDVPTVPSASPSFFSHSPTVADLTLAPSIRPQLSTQPCNFSVSSFPSFGVFFTVQFGYFFSST